MATCIPFAPGVPFLQGGPNWWDSSLPPSRPVQTVPDDPRWNQALSHSDGDGSGVQMVFRALQYAESLSPVTGHNLLLSWEVFVDPELDPGQDSVFVGFQSGGAGSPAMIVRITPATASSTVDGTSYAATVYTSTTGSSPWAAAVPAPAWVNNATRVWIETSVESQGALIWGIEMAVPIGTQLSPDAAHPITLQPGSANPFKMWYSVLNTVTPGSVVEYPWPGTPTTGGGAVFPDASSWVACYIPWGDDPACPATGVSINWWEVGTEDITTLATRPNASEIRLDLTNNPPTLSDNNHSNVFFASPEFPAGASSTEKQDIRATFRLANWGAQLGQLTSTSWFEIPNGQDIPYDLAKNQCHFQWPTGADLGQADTQSEIGAFRNGTHSLHCCMLVDLTSTLPGGETFTSNSVVRNMDVVNGSRFARTAEIAPGRPRDVYLYLEAVNMPAKVERNGGDQPTGKLGAAGAEGAPDLNVHAVIRGAQHPPDVIVRQRGIPMMRVHSYYDTGVTTTALGGSPRHVLRPLSSFGYIVQHDGRPQGWAPRLYGATRIARDLYLLHAPSHGVAQIDTGVHAVEPGEVVDPEPPIVPYPPKYGDELGALLTLLRQIINQLEELILAPQSPQRDENIRTRVALLNRVLAQIEALTASGASPILRIVVRELINVLDHIIKRAEPLIVPPINPHNITPAEALLRSAVQIIARIDQAIQGK